MITSACSLVLELGIFFQNFILRLCLSLKLRCICCRQQQDGFCFLIPSAILCLLIWKLRLFMFKVIIADVCWLQSFCFWLSSQFYFLSFIICIFIYLFNNYHLLSMFSPLFLPKFGSIVPDRTVLVDKNSFVICIMESFPSP